MHTTSIPRRLIEEVQVFRIRVATAESKLKLLREEARQARRRRKEAKRIAQRARKQFKRGKADVAELKHALARAETRLFEAGGRELARKMATVKAVRKPRKKTSNKPTLKTRRPRLETGTSMGPVRRSKQKTAAGGRLSTALLESVSVAPLISVADSRSYEQQVSHEERQEVEGEKV